MVELNKRFSRSGIKYGEIAFASISEEDATKGNILQQIKEVYIHLNNRIEWTKDTEVRQNLPEPYLTL